MSVASLSGKAAQPIFYVYEHWRPDTRSCFYVGKGHAGRAWSMKNRNRRHAGIQKKLAAAGLTVEVRLIAQNLIESDALSLEVARVALYPRDTLANFTNGGDGCSGYQHTQEFKDGLSARMKGIRLALGLKRSPETKAKLSAARVGKLSPILGYKFTDEQKARLAESGATRMTGHKHSEETRAKFSEMRQGKKRPPFSAEHREKISMTRTRKFTSIGRMAYALMCADTHLEGAIL